MSLRTAGAVTAPPTPAGRPGRTAVLGRTRFTLEVQQHLAAERRYRLPLSSNTHLDPMVWAQLFESTLGSTASLYQDSLLAGRRSAEVVETAVQAILASEFDDIQRGAVLRKLIAQQRLDASQWARITPVLASEEATRHNPDRWAVALIASEEIPLATRRSLASRCGIATGAALVAQHPGTDAGDAELLLGQHGELRSGDLATLATLASARPALGAELAALVAADRLLPIDVAAATLIALGVWEHSPQLTAIAVRDLAAYGGRNFDPKIAELLAAFLWDPTMPEELAGQIVRIAPSYLKVHTRYARRGPDVEVSAEALIDAPGHERDLAACRMWNHPGLTAGERRRFHERTTNAQPDPYHVRRLMRCLQRGANPFWEDPATIAESHGRPHVADDPDDYMLVGPWPWTLALDLVEEGDLDWPTARATAAALCSE